MIDPRHIEVGPIVVDEWIGLYKESWTGVIAPEAFAHPAKYSRALIRAIYLHCNELGWTRPGDSVVDPFGGVALGGFDAMQFGLHWTGCELEAKFVGLGNQNIALWNERFSRMPNWGTARLVQGDSRKLSEVLSEAQVVVSSPPYVTTSNQGGDQATHPGMKWDGVKPRIDRGVVDRKNYRGTNYGASEGQLGAMKEGDLNLAISSPPYVAISPEKSSKSVDYTKQYETYRSQGGGASFEKFVATQELHSGGYGDSDGQLSAMKVGDHALSISSPPFSQPETRDRAPVQDGSVSDFMNRAYTVDRQGQDERNLAGLPQTGFEAAVSSPPYSAEALGHAGAGNEIDEGKRLHSRCNNNQYGEADGQLGNQKGEDFWSASRIILEQLFQVIVPGGHAVFVVKAFVRNKKIVDFPAQWAQLCEVVGFKLLHDHHALLTEHKAKQPAMDDFDVQGETWRLVTRDRDHSVARKSFFRRLAESKGSPKIDYENVLCFEKPA